MAGVSDGAAGTAGAAGASGAVVGAAWVGLSAYFVVVQLLMNASAVMVKRTCFFMVLSLSKASKFFAHMVAWTSKTAS